MRPVAALAVVLFGCTGPAHTDETGAHDTGEVVDSADPPPAVIQREVLVNLDGEPIEGALVLQAGRQARWTTGADGRVVVDVDMLLDGDIVLTAAHPDARIQGVYPDWEYKEFDTIELSTFPTADNPAYEFQPPGDPLEDWNSRYCSHCHVSMVQDWWASPHRSSASNPVVHDVYAGAATAFATSEACGAAGGQWWTGIGPGTGEAADRCYLGAGTLPDLDETCGDTSPCDDVATAFGACADCHAPGIDGALGGRSLLEAVGTAYVGGVHCDVCHKVVSVDLAAAAGVAGRLEILRPTEPGSGLDLWRPLTFGPLPDVINPRMGSVYRPHYQQASFCAGCHELDQAALVPGATVDTDRWPEGKIPVHSTFSEWEAGPMNPAAPCQSCHMPPDAHAGNASDLDFFDIGAGPAGGWWRPAGEVRTHSWVGPRQPESGMLRLAAAVFLEHDLADGILTVSARVKNVGPGHAIPTGEPLRSLVLLVEATCDGAPLDAIGGDAVPDFGGFLQQKGSDDDWTRWLGARPGQVVRVVARPGGFHDYTGHGPFGNGRFDAADKGMPVEEVVGKAGIVAVASDGTVTLDRPLPEGDVAYLVDDPPLPGDGDATTGRAGSPGFAFARVLADRDGARMVPHHRAVDVVSDNRLLPQQSWTSTHRFAATCETPTAHAVLVHRAWPVALAAERAWPLTESVMVDTWR